jgi:hypothetical protein
MVIDAAPGVVAGGSEITFPAFQLERYDRQ